MIQVLPTEYRGVRFRSRLEARWAVYFDMIGVPWQYEPEGYQLRNGNYCPDFWCPKPCNFFIEVKPTEEAKLETLDKLRELAATTEREVYCVVGPPSVSPQWAVDGKGIDNGCAIFCHYAFAVKRWGFPYYGAGEKAFLDEPYWFLATNHRFDNGSASALFA